MSILSTRLKLIRIEKNIQQKEMAKLINVKPSTISNYETANSSPDTEKLIKISKILDVSIDYLLGLTEQRISTLSTKEALLVQEIKENNINIYDIEYLKKIKHDFKGLPDDVMLLNKIIETLNLNIKDFMKIFFDTKKEGDKEIL